MFAKRLLKEKGYEIEERLMDDLIDKRTSIKNIPDNFRSGLYTTHQLFTETEANCDTRPLSPQIFLDGKYIGGYNDLKKHFESAET
jgi:glutaredoxin